MDQHDTRCKVLPGEPPVTVTIRRSARARRIGLRVSGLDGRVTLTLPKGVAACEGLDFARAKEGWIRSHLSRGCAAEEIAVGVTLHVLGRDRSVVSGQDAPRLEDAAIVVSDRRPVGPQVAGIVREAARRAIEPLCRDHAARIGRPIGRITLRDTRSRWGSCSAAGNLNFSWRLAMAPLDVLDYVAAHEVAHLRHMDHSRAFWSVVEDLCPEWRRHRLWLRQNGTRLHAWRFG